MIVQNMDNETILGKIQLFKIVERVNLKYFHVEKLFLVNSHMRIIYHCLVRIWLICIKTAIYYATKLIFIDIEQAKMCIRQNVNKLLIQISALFQKKIKKINTLSPIELGCVNIQFNMCSLIRRSMNISARASSQWSKSCPFFSHRLGFRRPLAIWNWQIFTRCEK